MGRRDPGEVIDGLALRDLGGCSLVGEAELAELVDDGLTLLRGEPATAAEGDLDLERDEQLDEELRFAVGERTGVTEPFEVALVAFLRFGHDGLPSHSRLCFGTPRPKPVHPHASQRQGVIFLFAGVRSTAFSGPTVTTSSSMSVSSATVAFAGGSAGRSLGAISRCFFFEPPLTGV